MTRGSIQEYTEAVRGRYLKATRKGKGRILYEFTQRSGQKTKLDTSFYPLWGIHILPIAGVT